MKKLLLFIFSLGFFFSLASNVLAVSESEVWTIRDFKMEVAPVAGEEKIDFIEKIDTYFDPLVIEEYYLEKHGIFRYIPVYLPTDSGIFAFQYLLHDLNVKKADGSSWPYQHSFRSDLNSEFLKIGDANKLIEGQQYYEISYTVDNPWRYFDDHDEFYWNVTGNYWPVEMQSASLVFDISNLNIDYSDLDYICYTGAFSSTAQECVGEWDPSKKIFTVSASTVLGENEGLTVAISIPKGIVAKAGTFTLIKRFLWTNKILFFPLIFVLFFFWAWRKWGRDKHSDKPLMVEYLPADKLPPAMASYLYHMGASRNDVTAEIIWLAVHKYIKIKEIKEETLKIFKSTDYEFILLKKNYKEDKKLLEYQVYLLDKLFDDKESVNLSSLKNKFYVHLSSIQNKIFAYLKEQGYMKNRPGGKVALFVFLDVILHFVVGIAFVGVAPSYIQGSGIFALIISFIVCLIISIFMSRLELEKGIDAQWELKGLEHYLKVAEAERFKFGEMFFWFEKLLPYAIAMGLIKKWAGIMQDIYDQPPEWFEGADPSFNAMALATGLSSMTKDMSNTMGSRPGGSSSGGSGFSGGSSGGGGGGGGGGSW